MTPGSEFYRRRRRLAWVFALLCGSLSLLQGSLGLKQEAFLHPRVAAASTGAVIVCRTLTSEEDPGPYTRVLVVDPSFQVLSSALLQGDAVAVLVEGAETTSYFGNSASLLRNGGTVRRWDLGQPWPVRDAVLHPASGEAWILGWHDGKIVARRRTAEGFSDEVPVAEVKTRPLELAAAVDRGSGLVAAWRETESSPVRVAALAAGTFAARGEFALQADEDWEVVALGERILLLSYRPEDRTARAVTLRLRCCPGCGAPPPPERIEFLDPPILLGRGVTGIAAAVSGDRLVVAIARESLLQAASAPAATLLPEPGTALVPVGSDPLGRRAAAYFLKWFLFASALALIFLGTSMFREQRRMKAGLVPAAGGIQIADIPQRAMAVILDLLLVGPLVWAVMAEIFSSVSERMMLHEGRMVEFLLLCQPVNIAYHALCEAAAGATLGKWILGLRVLRADGSRLTIGAAILRNLLRPLEGEGMFLLGGLVMANSPRRQRLGDLLGRTIVVQDPPTAAPAAAAAAKS